VQKPRVQHQWGGGGEFVLSKLCIGENLYKLCIFCNHSNFNDYLENNSNQMNWMKYIICLIIQCCNQYVDIFPDEIIGNHGMPLINFVVKGITPVSGKNKKSIFFKTDFVSH